jgi:hypothetical protein
LADSTAVFGTPAAAAASATFKPSFEVLKFSDRRSPPCVIVASFTVTMAIWSTVMWRQCLFLLSENNSGLPS